RGRPDAAARARAACLARRAFLARGERGAERGQALAPDHGGHTASGPPARERDGHLRLVVPRRSGRWPEPRRTRSHLIITRRAVRSPCFEAQRTASGSRISVTTQRVACTCAARISAAATSAKATSSA